ncbi:uncharacterized protein RAG0_06099 [Rhynchosporium agropyri]|uniref:Uncharacterized protein n=1 Tax=Rhynchosporium agropyri TaxID=914238 RepID=A0A1E1KG20_9HELO|nr:uncharacterized protein RAG0_06099 [Rhynchosporium agropyri]
MRLLLTFTKLTISIYRLIKSLKLLNESNILRSRKKERLGSKRSSSRGIEGSKKVDKLEKSILPEYIKLRIRVIIIDNASIYRAPKVAILYATFGL